jgi:hypothetical protein
MNADASGPVGWIREIVLDCPNPWDLARFWAGPLGGTPVEWYPGWVTLEPPPHGQRLSFQGTGPAELPAPDRPASGSGGPIVQFHVLVDDLQCAHQRVIDAGGQYLGAHVSPRPGPGGEQIPWRVYTDPVGHPFCLVVR